MSADNFQPFTVVKLERALVKEENNGPSAMSGERQQKFSNGCLDFWPKDILSAASTTYVSEDL